MEYYAQLNEENICIGLTQTSGTIEGNNVVKLETYDAGLLGKRYENGEWTEVEPEPPEVQTTQLDRIEEAVNLSNDALRQEGADAVTLELIERGVL